MFKNFQASAFTFKNLEKILKAKKDGLRQADSKQLEEYLSVKPGSVTPLALLNLTAEQKEQVQFVVDEDIVSEYVAIHPMVNTSTIWIKTSELVSLLASNGIKISKVKLTEVIVEEKKVEPVKEKTKEAMNAQPATTSTTNNPYLLSVQYKKFENFSD